MTTKQVGFKLTPPIDPQNTEEVGSQKQLWVTFSPQHNTTRSNIKPMLCETICNNNFSLNAVFY